VPESAATLYPRPDLSYVPMVGLRPSEVLVVWPLNSRSPAVASLVLAATEVAVTAQPTALTALA
jgi:hypothetical protein